MRGKARQGGTGVLTKSRFLQKISKRKARRRRHAGNSARLPIKQKPVKIERDRAGKTVGDFDQRVLPERKKENQKPLPGVG